MSDEPPTSAPLTDIIVGDALRGLRVYCGHTIYTAGDLIGMDHRVLARLERGDRHCRVTEFVEIARSYGHSPERLFAAILGDEDERRSLDLRPLGDVTQPSRGRTGRPRKRPVQPE